MAAMKVRTRMGRKRQPAPPRSPGDPIHYKLARLVDKRKKGRTDAEIADAAGITPTYLSRALSGEAGSMTLETLGRLLAAIDANLCDLEKS